MRKRRQSLPAAATAAVAPPLASSAAASSSAAPEMSDASSPLAAATAIAPLPEQSLGRKRARHSQRTFSWLSVLAVVEVQLVLCCLDFRSRVAAARCNKQLYATASHPFAWPQEQTVMIQVKNKPALLQSVGARVIRSLLRFATIHLCVMLPAEVVGPLCPELFAVPNVHALTVRSAEEEEVAFDFLLPVLLHPAAQQLRSIDTSGFSVYSCSSAELQQLSTFPDLHSFSLNPGDGDDAPNKLQHVALFPSLTHLCVTLWVEDGSWGTRLDDLVLDSLVRCSRLSSLQLVNICINSELVNGLAQLPSLQRLYLRNGYGKKQKADAWAALRSLREIQLDNVNEVRWLLPALGSAPALRFLRWRCRGPPVHRVWCPLGLPDPQTFHKVLTEAPLLQIELLVPYARLGRGRALLELVRDAPGERRCPMAPTRDLLRRVKAAARRWANNEVATLAETGPTVAMDRKLSRYRRDVGEGWPRTDAASARPLRRRVHLVEVERDHDDWRAASCTK